MTAHLFEPVKLEVLFYQSSCFLFTLENKAKCVRLFLNFVVKNTFIV